MKLRQLLLSFLSISAVRSASLRGADFLHEEQNIETQFKDNEKQQGQRMLNDVLLAGDTLPLNGVGHMGLIGLIMDDTTSHPQVISEETAKCGAVILEIYLVSTAYDCEEAIGVSDLPDKNDFLNKVGIHITSLPTSNDYHARRQRGRRLYFGGVYGWTCGNMCSLDDDGPGRLLVESRRLGKEVIADYLTCMGQTIRADLSSACPGFDQLRDIDFDILY